MFSGMLYPSIIQNGYLCWDELPDQGRGHGNISCYCFVEFWLSATQNNAIDSEWAHLIKAAVHEWMLQCIPHNVGKWRLSMHMIL